ncbi:MAG: prolyl oligopeptidase family serine peptidase [Clostridiales bacterium]|nr:prolyl oligopeptidase family serine peptidase [Clostridiales bacterium]
MNDTATLRAAIAAAIGLHYTPAAPQYKITEESRQDGYTRQRIEYAYDGDTIPAFLLIPDGPGPHPAVLVHHQHNGERHLGKSEVVGLTGNPLQAFGPALARRGFVVLAPDSVCFEARRRNASGTIPLPGDDDFMQHYNEMCYHILAGGNLMQKVLEDAMQGVRLLENLDFVDAARIGTLGHSYGGNTALFLAALDPRLRFACASGAAVTYRNRMQHDVGIEMASVIPGFIAKYDIDDIAHCIAPRRLLLVSASGDKYSRDADSIAERALPQFGADRLYHKRYTGGHALTAERFAYIVDWIVSVCST